MKRETIATLAAGTPLALLLILGPVWPGAASAWALLLVLVGFAGAAWWRTLPRAGWWLVWAQVFYALGAVLSLLNTSNWHFAEWRLERYHPFLLTIPLLMLCYRYADRLRPWLRNGVLASGGAILFFSVYSRWVVGEPRIGGLADLNPNIFGHVASLILLCALGFGLLERGLRPAWRALLLGSAAGAGLGVVLSGSRGVMLAVLAALPVLVWQGLRTGGRRQRLAIVAAGLLALAGLGVSLATSPVWRQQIESVLVEIEQYRAGDTTYTSVGSRLTVWSGAWEIWKRHPLIGTGVGDPQDDLKALHAEGAILAMKEASFPFFHNMYADSLATTGLIGIAGLMLAVLLLPGWIFARAWDADPAVAATGLALLVNNAVFGLTNSWLYLRGLPIVLALQIVLLALALRETTDEFGRSTRSAR